MNGFFQPYTNMGKEILLCVAWTIFHVAQNKHVLFIMYHMCNNHAIHTRVIKALLLYTHISSSNNSVNVSDFGEVLAQASHIKINILPIMQQCFNSSTHSQKKSHQHLLLQILSQVNSQCTCADVRSTVQPVVYICVLYLDAQQTSSVPHLVVSCLLVTGEACSATTPKEFCSCENNLQQ